MQQVAAVETESHMFGQIFAIGQFLNSFNQGTATASHYGARVRPSFRPNIEALTLGMLVGRHHGFWNAQRLGGAAQRGF